MIWYVILSTMIDNLGSCTFGVSIIIMTYIVIVLVIISITISATSYCILIINILHEIILCEGLAPFHNQRKAAVGFQDTEIYGLKGLAGLASFCGFKASLRLVSRVLSFARQCSNGHWV